MALTTTNGMSIDDLTAAANGPGLAQQLGNQVDEFYGKSVANAAALPAAGKFVGQRVWLVDTKVFATWNGTAWVQLQANGELGYAEITANFSVTTTTETDVPGLAITINVGTRPVWIEMGLDMGHTTAALGYCLAYLKEGTTKLQQAGVYDNVVQNQTVMNGRRLTPTAGLHTYKVSVYAPTAGTGVQVVANSAQPAWIRAVEL